MARMYPEALPAYVRNDPKRRSEVRVYEALRDGLPKSYVAYYGVRWLEKGDAGKPKAGEADFVVAHATYGVIVLEVKGGRISKHGPSGQWFSMDRDGEKHAIKNPYEQAEQNKFALLRRIKQNHHWRQRWVDAGHGVVFPSIAQVEGALGLDAPEEITLCSTDLEHLEKRIPLMYDFWQKRREFGADGVSLLTKILAPSFELQNPLQQSIAQADRHLLTLTEEQFQILDMTADVPQALIGGGAGTGKTLMALEKARRLADDGLSTLVTCFSPSLAAFLRNSHGAQHDNLRIESFPELCARLAGNNDLSVADIGDLSVENKRQLSDALLDAMESNQERYDAIIVDEGQDFIEDWWAALELLMKEKGAGIFYVFYDDNQLIHQGDLALPRIPMKLTVSNVVRNTDEIFSLSKRFHDGPKLRSSRVSGEAVRTVPVRHDETVTGRLEKTISRLLDEKVVLADIAVLVSGTSSNLFTAQKIGKHSVRHLGEARSGLLIETISNYKGLDAPVVILADLGPILRPGSLSVEKLYVGTSRARSLLILLGSENELKALAG